ncbi:MAG: 5-carboxymethyl-2-hydroxymuconate Delta-isomerase [Marinovum sp.]|nr:5-carboxymethyl-2-hydroxymuconate Delta-isomerase [Marinovum sp.]
MPHLHIEYSANLEAITDVGALCQALHGRMVDSRVFPTAGIRVRAFKANHAIVADGLLENAFVAMTLSVGAGRTVETLRAEGDALFAVAQNHLAGPLSKPHFALSLEIRVSDPELSWKDTPIHARLSKGK